MWIIGWIILGAIAGWIASRIVNKHGEGFIGDVILGIIGAVVGGFIFNAIVPGMAEGGWIWSLFVAVIGAIIVLWIYHMIVGRRTTI